MTWSLVLAQSLHGFIMDTSNKFDDRVEINSLFGDFKKSLYTMFEVTYSGGWPNYSRPLVENVSPWYSIIVLVYVLLVVFAMIRIVTALFIKETLSCAANDAEIALEEKRRSAMRYQAKLEEFFCSADVDGDGNLSQDEFTAALSNPEVLRYLTVLDIQIKEVSPLFSLLDDGDGLVTIAEFCGGITHLKGQARALDVTILQHDNLKIRKELQDIKSDLRRALRYGWES
eukprot:CAMPEP_0197640518 /NCGR_PEP_ID=MMETSP1338-20131121/14781_1 /TAXON_ID=43686 ORGANISM="Pelagodinium beii, Strain RCC1491" /NCGR_SAMPLE_ID=MMETSP1338 /ASSEMBLY_ACC=CAM_ASM_000754 /LENGTH=228 /DNA_ID=CAMNT_0043213379 /DNA_START=211 /DNA_END=897 /DNA_ORIENTATION=+